ncbi:hypothetical protein PUATCC27989T_00490 [Phytobacter ursingii]|nr:hypothetical protein PUATCC27989T_00490 [Phytobacter ursingii]
MTDNTLNILFAEYIKANCTGGSLHIAYDDGNVSDSDIAFCYRYAEKNGDVAGMVIAGFLMDMSEEERNEFFNQSIDEFAGTFEGEIIMEESIQAAMKRIAPEK